MRWRWRPGSGWAMIQRSRATQDARAGEVSAEGVEKMGFAILDFARSARETRFAGSKTAPGRRMRLAGTKDGASAFSIDQPRSRSCADRGRYPEFPFGISN